MDCSLANKPSHNMYPFCPKRAPSSTSLVGSVADLRTGCRWFDLRLGQYSFQGLMIVIAAGFIPLSPLSIALEIVMWESSQWLEKKLVRSAGSMNSRNAWIGALAAAI